jgi:hypothetical protein
MAPRKLSADNSVLLWLTALLSCRKLIFQTDNLESNINRSITQNRLSINDQLTTIFFPTRCLAVVRMRKYAPTASRSVEISVRNGIFATV